MVFHFLQMFLKWIFKVFFTKTNVYRTERILNTHTVNYLPYNIVCLNAVHQYALHDKINIIIMYIGNIFKW